MEPSTNTGTEWPSLSIIVVTKNHNELAVKALHSIREAEYPKDKKQIIVLEEIDHPNPIEGDEIEYHAIPAKNRGGGPMREIRHWVLPKRTSLFLPMTIAWSISFG